MRGLFVRHQPEQFRLRSSTGFSNVDVTRSERKGVGHYATTLQTWQQTYFTPEKLDDPAISGDLAGSRRTQQSVRILVELRSENTVNVERPTVVRDSSYLSLTYTKVLAATDLVYTVEESIDLMNWTPAASIDQVLLDDGVTQRIKANVPVEDARSCSGRSTFRISGEATLLSPAKRRPSA